MKTLREWVRSGFSTRQATALLGTDDTYTPPSPTAGWSKSFFASAVATGDKVSWAGGSGPSPLNRTDPLNPTFVADGLYAVCASAGPDDGVHAGKSQRLELRLTHGGTVIDAIQSTPLDFGGSGGPCGEASLTWFAHAGDVLWLKIEHDLGVPTDWDVNLSVQPL